MNSNRVAAILIRQFDLMRGTTSRILPLFVWVAIDIVLWGFITKYLNAVSSSPFDFVPVLLGAALLWDFFTRVMTGVTMAFFEDVWSRNFLNLFASPLSIGEYLAGLVTSSILTSLIGLLVMFAVATLVFGWSFLAYGGMVVPFLLVLFLFGIAIGILGASIVLRLGPSAEWLVWPIPAVVSPFAGVFYPVSTLPVWMRWVAYGLPPSYVFEGLRAIVERKAWEPATLAAAVALAIVYVMFACWVFTRVYRHAVRTGLIARYSAETIN